MAKFYAKAPNGDDAVLSISIQNFTQSLQQNGWCKLPNGLIIQWLWVYSSVSGVETAALPITVSTHNRCVTCYGNGSGDGTFAVVSMTTSGGLSTVTFRNLSIYSNGTIIRHTENRISLIAIGY